MPRKLVLIAVLTAALVVSGRAQQPSSLANLKTTAEASDYKSTSTYDDVVKFMKAVDDGVADRLLHDVRQDVRGPRRCRWPSSARAQGREPGGGARRPASCACTSRATSTRARSRARNPRRCCCASSRMGQHADWLRSMVFLITPIFNADGNEKFALTNRGRQNGPDQRHGHARERPEPEHQPRLHEARDAGRPRVREAVERLRPAGRLRPAHV